MKVFAISSASGKLGAEIVNGIYIEPDVEYREDRVADLGEFLGNVIAGIYEGIRIGASNKVSHFQDATGREHKCWDHYFRQLAK